MKCLSKTARYNKYKLEQERKIAEKQAYIASLSEEERIEYYAAEEKRREDAHKSLQHLTSMFGAITSMCDSNPYTFMDSKSIKTLNKLNKATSNHKDSEV